jgi:hypothetical protein
MDLLSGFHLDSDISVSELRQEELLDKRLHEHGRLRLRRRNEVLGIVVETDAWRALDAYVHELERRLEEASVREIIAQREPSATFVSGEGAVEEASRLYLEGTKE